MYQGATSLPNTGTGAALVGATVSPSLQWAFTILAVWTILMFVAAVWRLRPVVEM